MTHRILFICSGNMYRSAGAEFILRKKLADEGITGWTADSAGTLELGGVSRPEDFGHIDTILEGIHNMYTQPMLTRQTLSSSWSLNTSRSCAALSRRKIGAGYIRSCSSALAAGLY